MGDLLEAAIGIEPMNKAFAELCLTTWLRRPEKNMRAEGSGMNKKSLTFILHPSALILQKTGAGNET